MSEAKRKRGECPEKFSEKQEEPPTVKTTLFFFLIVICSTAGFPHITLAQDDRSIVQVVYFRASDKPPRPNVDAEIDGLIKKAQRFFADGMGHHGFGRKTFQVEIDANGNTVVHHVVGKFPYAHYLENLFDWAEETREQVGIFLEHRRNIVVYMIETRGEKEFPGGAAGHGSEGRASVYGWGWWVVAHELGHACWLSHDFRDDTYIMSYGGGRRTRLSKCAAEWLNVHRAFTPGQPALWQRSNTTIKLLSLTPAPPPNGLHLRFKVTDPDGIHQVQLLTREHTIRVEDRIQRVGGLVDCEQLNGNPSSIVEFVTPKLTPEQTKYIWIRTIDSLGYMGWDGFHTPLPDLPDRLAPDVNGDSVVDIEDLMLVASSFGTASAPDTLPDTDVNDDGEVNDADVELVLAALEGAPAAPALEAEWTAASLQRWLAEAKRQSRRDAAFQRGIAVLERWLATLLPKETVLLPNYPNPFNPETWIPYQLSEPAAVVVHIYGVNGALVRTLGLGHQLAGTYQNRTRAAYWDGRNQLGEPVASGIYFYTLSAGDFTATRKMLIQK